MEPERVPKAEIAASLEAGRELGPDYDDAIAASLVEHIDDAIEARIREQVQHQLAQRPDTGRPHSNNTAIGITAFASLLFGAPASASLAQSSGMSGLALIWAGIIVVNLIVFLATRGDLKR